MHGVTGQSSLGPGTGRYPTQRGLQEKAVQGVDLKIKLPVIFINEVRFWGGVAEEL